MVAETSVGGRNVGAVVDGVEMTAADVIDRVVWL